MAKLYPPMLDGTLPAFAGSELNIPLQMNRAVGLNQIGGMKLTIKTVTTGVVIASITADFTSTPDKGDGKDNKLYLNPATNNYIAHFDISKYYSKTLENGKVCPGQYYKVQLAFLDKSTVKVTGYWSSIAVTKCTTLPDLTIPATYLDGYHSDFVGEYDQSGQDKDGTEKVYTYYFTIKDENGDVIATSGEQLHNSSTDTATNKSSDSWHLEKTLEEDVNYTIEYGVTTMNGLVVNPIVRDLVSKETIAPNLPFELIAVADNDEGCNKLYFRPIQDKTLSGSYAISRANDEDNYENWEELYRFSFDKYNFSVRPNKPEYFYSDAFDILVWEDFTTVQGVHYKYAIQQFNSNGLYSSRQLNTREIADPSSSDDNPKTIFTSDGAEVFVDFVDMFLFDGERQLKLQFNPKVSSFKTTVLEQKTNTLGGKYPFIFRNGSVEFKEFPISGLLSLLSDPAGKFLDGVQERYYVPRTQTPDGLDINYNFDTNLTGDNMYRERVFKLAALNWLNNGEPKLFRSPGEGNYIVRLMSISLAPNDTLGRMIHTASGQACEIADYTFENLQAYNFIRYPYGENKHFKIAQVQTSDIPAAFAVSDTASVISLPYAYHLNITEAREGTIIGLNFADNSSMVTVEIGGTGAYYVLIDKPVISLTLIRGSWEDCGKITYCYYDDEISDSFNSIANIQSTDEIRQFIGIGLNVDIIDLISDIRRQPGRFNYIRLLQRSIDNIYKMSNGQYSRNIVGNDIVEDHEWNAAKIYRVYDFNNPSVRLGYLYGLDKTISKSTPSYEVYLNSSHYVLDMGGNVESAPTTLGRIDALTNIKHVDTFRIGSGVWADVCYRLKEVTYTLEMENTVVKEAKAVWQQAKQSWEENPSEENRIAMNGAYEYYVEMLEKALEVEQQTIGGSL